MDVLMPQLGETVSEGKIIKWLKAVGDSVAPGDNLCEIETDKVTVEVPAISAGIIQAINVDAGSVAPVGAVIAVLGGPDNAAIEAYGAPPAPPLAAPSPVPAPMIAPPPAMASPRPHRDPFEEVVTPPRNFGPARLSNGVRVTPLARRLAANAAIDLAGIAGSGGRGRIIGKDVQHAVAARPAPAPSLARADTFDELIGAVHRSRPHSMVPVDTMRRTIARRLTEAKATIPHFYLSVDATADRLARMREEINAGAPHAAAGNPAYKLSLNDFMIKAMALALQAVPRANAIWSSDGILAFRHSDIGVAVAVEGGLLTPVIAAAEQKSLSSISNEMKALAARARDRTLQPHEYQGGVTTISNLGMHGIRDFSAIINPPQSTILAIGATRREAIETEAGGVAFVGRVSATLSCDHRVVDGVLGAELLESFREFIENPLRLVV
jgi:pyruvate dehydrogenase E2 component (dihydrolipoamide acetyltransferase)